MAKLFLGFDFNPGIVRYENLKELANQKVDNLPKPLQKSGSVALSKIEAETKKPVELDNPMIADTGLSDKRFKQPPSETFSIYDAAAPIVKPDTSTPIKKAIVDVENQIRNDELETAVIFNKEGDVLLRKQDKPDSVSFNEQELQLFSGNVATHNHPRGTTFSFTDVEMAINYGLAEVRIVTPTLRYSFSPAVSWPPIIAMLGAFDSAKAEVNQRINEMVRSGEIHPQFAEAEYLHYIWLNVAKDLNLTYKREKS